MTDLRAAVIEALDVAVTNDGYWHVPSECIEAGLNAVLDTLADRADEWDTELDDEYWDVMTTGDFDQIEAFVTRRLIAVLRGDT